MGVPQQIHFIKSRQCEGLAEGGANQIDNLLRLFRELYCQSAAGKNSKTILKK